jgi:hypothetical protein
VLFDPAETSILVSQLPDENQQLTFLGIYNSMKKRVLVTRRRKTSYHNSTLMDVPATCGGYGRFSAFRSYDNLGITHWYEIMRGL